MRTCRDCGERLHRSAFGIDNAQTDGLRRICRACDRARVIRWRMANATKARAGYRQSQRVRAARMRDAVCTEHAVCREIDLLRVFVMANGVCSVCRQPVEDDAFDFDHELPLAAGGLHCMFNLRPSHASCNRSKGAKE